MAKYDVEIVKTGGAHEVTFLTAAATSLYPGDPVKKNGDYVTRVATGDPEIGTDEFIGVCLNASTDTASAAGEVRVMVFAPDTVGRIKATTSGNVDTDAKINALKMHSVAFDVDSTTVTIDEDEADDPNVHGLYIIGGDKDKGTLDFIVNSGARAAGGSVGQTRD